MRIKLTVDAVFGDGWCEQEASAEVVSAIVAELFDRNALQVTISRES